MSTDDDNDASTRIVGNTPAAPSTAADQEPAEPDATVIRVPSRAPKVAAEAATRIQAYAPPAAASSVVASSGAAPSPAAPGASGAAGEHDNMLPIGTYLGEFELLKVLGEGGFGIVYLAQDHSLGRRVALKEYMPSSLAARGAGAQVSVKSERHRETFETGLRSFVNEARLLAQFDHPSLVKVYRFWEANGTAYMVMPFYEGVTLKQQLKEFGKPPDEAWLRELLGPLSEALSVIHAEQCFHRDIAPDNVILLKGSNRPLLLDFGAARRVIGDMTQALTVILKPGYAPVEQYAEVPGMKQGPWTDVYALAAVVYFSITGKTPPTSVARLMNDSYVPMRDAGAGRYSLAFLAAIDHALAVKPEDRTQSIEQLRHELGMGSIDDAVAAAPVPVRRPASAVSHNARVSAERAASSGAAGGPASGAVPSRRLALVVAAGFAGVVVAAGGLYAVLGRDRPAAAPLATAPLSTAPSTSSTAPPTVSAKAPAADALAASALASSAPAATGALPTVGPVASTVPGTPAVTAPLADPNQPFSPARDFEAVVARQSPDYPVFAAVTKTPLRIGKDNMTFSVKSEKEGHLYVFLQGTDGVVMQLFPNGLAKSNRIRAGSTLTLPPAGSNWTLPTGGPAGTDHFVAIVSAHPREFPGIGMKVKDGFGQTTLAAVTQAARANKSGVSIFAGRPVCEPPCTDDYGATVFAVDEVN